MTSSLATRVIHQRGFLVALVTGASVLAALVAQAFLIDLFGFVGVLASGQGFDGSGGWPLAVLGQAAVTYLPFAIGVFLSLWLIAPVASDLRLFHVLTRSLLAAGIGAVLAIIVSVVAALFGAFSYSAAFSSNVFGNVGYDLSGALSRMGFALGNGLTLFATGLPIVVLACVLLWIWLERHPRGHSVSGFLDEV